jgi:hypothetical protein
MVFKAQLDQISRRLQGATKGPWTVESDPGIGRYIQTGRSQGESRLRVKRNLNPASDEDIEFIAIARQALPRLIQALESGRTDLVSPAELDEYEEAASRATPGPWTPFIEELQPIGGSSVIWVGGENDPDMYVWLGSEIAPAGDVDFVAHARQDVPDLIVELRRRMPDGKGHG